MDQRQDYTGVRVRVSIIVPASNAETSIAAAVASVQAQTVVNREAIVVDDAATDSTTEVLRRISAGDPRIRIVRNVANLGPDGSPPVGLCMARGDRVALIDADDHFRIARLATLLLLAEQADADMVADNLVLCDETTGSTRLLIDESRFPTVPFMPFQEFVGSCYFGDDAPQRSGYVFMHPVVRRAFLERHQPRYDPLVPKGEDFLFYLDCLTACSLGCHAWGRVFVSGPRWNDDERRPKP